MIRMAAIIATAGALASVAGDLVTFTPRVPSQRVPDVLARSIAAYAALTSYSDTGSVELESVGMIDRSKFTTRFRRATGDIYFEYQDIGTYYPDTKVSLDMSANRVVIWMLRGRMETFEQHTRTHTVVEANRQASALAGPGAWTKGVSLLMASLLYPQAKMRSTVFEIEDASDAGFEEVANRRCHKVIGTAAQYYPSGARTGVRPVAVWIDAETLLIRRIFEDTPEGLAAGARSRLTVTIDPQPNPELGDASFQFKVPAQ